MQLVTHGTIRPGEVLSYVQTEDGQWFVVPANPAEHKQTPIGVALEAIPEGTIILWKPATREGFIDTRRVVLGVMTPDDGVHIKES